MRQTGENLTNTGGIAEMSSLQIIGHLNLRFSAESFKRNSLPQRRNLAPLTSHPALGTKIWNSASAYNSTPPPPATLPHPIPRDVLQNISSSSGFHYLMISDILHRNEN